VTVDTQNGNWSDSVPGGGNCLVEPPFDKLGVRSKTKLVGTTLDLFDRHLKVIVVERAVCVFGPLEGRRAIDFLRGLDSLERIEEPDVAIRRPSLPEQVCHEERRTTTPDPTFDKRSWNVFLQARAHLPGEVNQALPRKHSQWPQPVQDRPKPKNLNGSLGVQSSAAHAFCKHLEPPQHHRKQTTLHITVSRQPYTAPSGLQIENDD